VSFGSGAGRTGVVSPLFVELGGVEVADSGACDDASADCSVEVEVATDTVDTPVMIPSVMVIGASPLDFVDVR